VWGGHSCPLYISEDLRSGRVRKAFNRKVRQGGAKFAKKNMVKRRFSLRPWSLFFASFAAKRLFGS
jgi:hypothetical protein